MVEIIISVLAILIILSLGRLGILFGVFYELTSASLLLLAMMVTLRYWYPLTRWLMTWWPGAEGSYMAFGAYWILFLLGCMPLILIMNYVTQDSIPKYPKVVDVVLGSIFGMTSAVILVCCVMTSLSVIVPKVWEPYNRNALLMPLDQVPIAIYQTVERRWLDIPESDPSHTRLPTFNKEDVDNLDKYWR
jgi:uncharacterized membrane protein required for colicin V production